MTRFTVPDQVDENERPESTNADDNGKPNNADDNGEPTNADDNDEPTNADDNGKPTSHVTDCVTTLYDGSNDVHVHPQLQLIEDIFTEERFYNSKIGLFLESKYQQQSNEALTAIKAIFTEDNFSGSTIGSFLESKYQQQSNEALTAIKAIFTEDNFSGSTIGSFLESKYQQQPNEALTAIKAIFTEDNFSGSTIGSFLESRYQPLSEPKENFSMFWYFCWRISLVYCLLLIGVLVSVGMVDLDSGIALLEHQKGIVATTALTIFVVIKTLNKGFTILLIVFTTAFSILASTFAIIGIIHINNLSNERNRRRNSEP